MEKLRTNEAEGIVIIMLTKGGKGEDRIVDMLGLNLKFPSS